MDEDGDDKDDTKRRTRNLSEKKRRDQFNMLVTELSTLITSNDRKMDKSTVLKSTISYLKDHNEVTVRSRAHDVQEDWKPAFLSNEEFIYLVLEALEGFVMVFSASGRIYYVSESITSVLGHNPEDIVNKSIFDLTCEEDRANLYTLLQRNATDQIPNASQEIVMIRFHIRLRRGTLDFREEVSYDLIQFYGHFRTNQEQADVDRDIADQQNLESRVIFVSIGHLHTPQLIRGISLVDTSRCEFISRHSLEWKFLFLDHRAPPIIGYLPFEVLGTSGYDYYHFDDLEKVVTCHEDLMQKGELTSCYYRFLTKGQQWIWLQSRFYITYHQWNSKPEFVVCTHRVVSCEDVTRITKEEDVEQDTDLSDGEGTQINLVKDTPIDELQAPMSPSYVSEAASDAFGSSYQPISQPASVKSASVGSVTGTIATAASRGASQKRARRRFVAGSDTASCSGESRSSQRNSEQGSHKTAETVAPQHGIGAQYLDPSPYVAGVPVSPGVLQLSTLPVLVTPEQVQIQWPWQEQLQRKHEELQQMILQQQEELRQVKEQLLLARLGILQPLISVPNPYSTPEEIQNQQRLTAQLAYSNAQLPITGYPPQVPLLPLTTLLPHPLHPPHPPHPSDPHQHMTQ